ncbi:MAG: hypothetical protein Q7K40_00280 [bacterium]|nr:hypothetical protein [bacterium]
MLPTQKIKAIKLRKEGMSYSEILEVVPVAKSTLSIWLRSVNLSKPQQQRLTAKKLAAGKRGGASRKAARKHITSEILNKSEKQIGVISKRELFLVGTVLYWAEGTKEKEDAPGSGIQFTNSDPKMLITFLSWLRDSCSIEDGRIHFQIYLHETSDGRIKEVVEYWSKNLMVTQDRLNKVYFKRNKVSTNRKNTGEHYFGLVRIKVRRSSGLVRAISGWVNGITESLQCQND